ncbi:hypothetical protein LEP1GSC017_0449 [Leptospira meyeri serovar Hardjo str. Went 5]|nr:hypothetical protein [Leptospira meyeri]EKJ86717.1 hypothetical protein LEP1GSC017_0449 [Leptospira meyeri serovar Hardjo str. Went 5]
MKLKTSIVFLITIAILLPSILFTFFLYNTRAIPEIIIKINFSEAIDTENNKKLVLAKDSLNDIKEVISSIKQLPSEEKLLAIYEREREHYILLISIITLILTIISVYFIFSRFVEKEEYEDLKKSITILQNELKNSINESRFNNLIQEVKAKTTAFNDFIILVDYDSKTPITNKKEFEKHIEDDYNSMIQKFSNYINNPNLDKAYSTLYNYILSICRYGLQKGFEVPEPGKGIETHPYFSLQLKHIIRIFGKEKYGEIRNEWKKVFPFMDLP